MKLSAAVMLLGLLATSRCPGSVKPLDENPNVEDPHQDCQWMQGSWDACAPGTRQIDPQDRLGFNKRYYERVPQAAIVDSVSGASLVLEGPWNMPYTFTWFDGLEDSFAVGDEVELWGAEDWSVVTSAGATLAHLDTGGFSSPPPSRPTEDGPLVDFVAACTADDGDTVYGIVATLGDDSVEIAQGARGRIGDWEILFHGAASAPGYTVDCMIVEGYFHGVVSAWKRP